MDEQRANDGGVGSGLMLLATALMALGLVMVASTSASLDRSLFSPGWLQTTFGRQVLFVSAGLLLMVLMSRLAVPFLGSRVSRRWVPWVLCVVALGLLLAALIPGVSHAAHGSQRWLRFGLGGLVVGVQPSDVAKLALVTLLAWMLSSPTSEPRSFRRGFVPLTAVIGVFVLLVGKEDFGTSALIAAVAGLMLLVGGCRLRHLAGLAVLGGAGLALLIWLERYRVERLMAFRDLAADPSGVGYQPVQSLVTIASGGWFGAGLGAGVQKYGYLPECRTDFIFSALCEEMGGAGGILVICLYAACVWLGLKTMLIARSRFERLLAFGLTVMMGGQAAMNIAVVTVLAPTTGISMPLVSAGGSGTIAYAVAIGVLAAIARRGQARFDRGRFAGFQPEDTGEAQVSGSATSW